MYNWHHIISRFFGVWSSVCGLNVNVHFVIITNFTARMRCFFGTSKRSPSFVVWTQIMSMVRTWTFTSKSHMIIEINVIARLCLNQATVPCSYNIICLMGLPNQSVHTLVLSILSPYSLESTTTLVQRNNLDNATFNGKSTLTSPVNIISHLE